MQKHTSVLVADSSRIHTQLLSEILGRDFDLQVIHWDFDQTRIASTAADHAANVLVLSSVLNGGCEESLAIVKEMRETTPGTRIVVLLDSLHEQTVLDFLRSGARGIFPREGSLDMLRKCIHTVNRGEIWLDNQRLSLLVESLASAPALPSIKAKGIETLTRREHEVLEWMVQGLSNREISDRMQISPHTVKNYILRIFDKMGVSSRAELLFLVLSQSHAEEREMGPQALTRGPIDEHTLSVLSEEAEKGSPVAQLGLAQAYAVRADHPGNFTRAYKWYRIVSERIAKAHSTLAQSMTPKELEETEREATLWLKHRNQPATNDPADSSNMRKTPQNPCLAAYARAR